MRMPFGKYKGHELSAIPFDYLEWLLTHTELREPLKGAVKGLVHLGGAAPPKTAPAEPELKPGSRLPSKAELDEFVAVAMDIVGVGRRTLEGTWPDHTLDGVENALKELIRATKRAKTNGS